MWHIQHSSDTCACVKSVLCAFSIEMKYEDITTNPHYIWTRQPAGVATRFICSHSKCSLDHNALHTICRTVPNRSTKRRLKELRTEPWGAFLHFFAWAEKLWHAQTLEHAFAGEVFGNLNTIRTSTHWFGIARIDITYYMRCSNIVRSRICKIKHRDISTRRSQIECKDQDQEWQRRPQPQRRRRRQSIRVVACFLSNRSHKSIAAIAQQHRAHRAHEQQIQHKKYAYTLPIYLCLERASSNFVVKLSHCGCALPLLLPRQNSVSSVRAFCVLY